MITSLPLAFLIGDETPMELFKNGGLVMWPILLVSFIALTVVVEARALHHPRKLPP